MIHPQNAADDGLSAQPTSRVVRPPRGVRGDPIKVALRSDCSVGHRALVAYERRDGQHTLHYNHWGAAKLKLKHRISAEAPFGGEDTDSKWSRNKLLAELADSLEADAVDGHRAESPRHQAHPRRDLH